jgi:hypothetical protein
MKSRYFPFRQRECLPGGAGTGGGDATSLPPPAPATAPAPGGDGTTTAVAVDGVPLRVVEVASPDTGDRVRGAEPVASLEGWCVCPATACVPAVPSSTCTCSSSRRKHRYIYAMYRLWKHPCRTHLYAYLICINDPTEAAAAAEGRC